MEIFLLLVISLLSFLGNASSANKWFAPRTFTIGHTGKSVDGTQNISWTLEEIGASYYHSTSWNFTKGHSNGYVTFDQSAATGGPSGEAWVNGFVSTHNNYLSSYIVNGHRGNNWYLGYSEHSDTVTKNPTWRKIIHDGNYTDYTVTKTGSGASGTWGINISGNAATASKWVTGRTFTIGGTAKSVDGSSNVSWSAAEIGVPYVYHTGPGFSAYANWGMMISRTRNTYGESGKADNYYIATDASNNLRTGHQLNGTADITWTNILNERNYMNYCAPISHNHTSLSNITSLAFATHTDDAATIGANVDGSSTYFDFNLLDDGAMDKFRWRFGRYDSATATMPWSDLMTLTTISPTDSTAYLRVNGTISADWFSGTASNASYLVSLGGTTTASVRNYDSVVSLSTGGWSDSNAGYGYTWGTTLDISGYSTWYHRLAFRTDGQIEYWHGINTKTMSKVGILLTSANYTSYCAPASHSHNYVTPGTPNNLMHSGNEFTFAPAGYSGSVWFNYRTAGWETNGNISQYIFGNGKGGCAPIEHLYDITHNYGAYNPNNQSPPGTGVQGAIFYQI